MCETGRDFASGCRRGGAAPPGPKAGRIRSHGRTRRRAQARAPRRDRATSNVRKRRSQGWVRRRGRDRRCRRGRRQRTQRLRRRRRQSRRNPPGGLEKYYRENVIGGPGAFVLVAKDFNSFGNLLIKKLIAEIALVAPRAE